MEMIEVEPQYISLTRNKVANIKVCERIREEGYKVGYDAIIIADGKAILSMERKLNAIRKMAKKELGKNEAADIEEAVDSLIQTIIPEAGLEQEGLYVVDGISRLLGLRLSYDAVKNKNKVIATYDKKNAKMFQTEMRFLYVSRRTLRKINERTLWGWDVLNFLSLYKETDKAFLIRLARYLYARAAYVKNKSDIFEVGHEIIDLLYPTEKINFEQLDALSVVPIGKNAERVCPSQYTVKTDIYQDIWKTAALKGETSVKESGKYLTEFNKIVVDYANKDVLSGTGVEARFFSREILGNIPYETFGLDKVVSPKGIRWKRFLKNVRKSIDDEIAARKI
jgi:hypothetical protein